MCCLSFRSFDLTAVRHEIFSVVGRKIESTPTVFFIFRPGTGGLTSC